MPRDGTQTYILPFPDVVADTTIESPVYNGFTNDVAQDLNTPRPIVAGGTGATSAASAIVNLGAEQAAQVVTNYDSFLFKAGSFYSTAGATSAPTANAASGICYTTDASNMVVEARDSTTGTLYVRRKTTGTWGAWAAQGGSVTDLDAAYVNVAGDTMTGPLVLPVAAPTLGTHATNKTYVDAGDALKVAKAGDTMTGTLTVTGGNISASGSVSGSSVVSSAGITSGAPIMATYSATPAQGTVYLGNTNNVFISYDSLNLVLAAPNPIKLGTGFLSRTGLSGTYGTATHNFFWTGAVLQAYVDTSNVGTIAFTSDYRTKKDITELPTMWEAVKALRPIKYTQKAYKELFTADDIERWGFVAHELQSTLTPSAATGEKDAPDIIQSPNPFTLIAALTKALQEAMTRIEALEAR